MCVVRRMVGAQDYSVGLWLGWFGGFDCAMVSVALGDARPLLLSPCNTHMKCYPYIDHTLKLWLVGRGLRSCDQPRDGLASSKVLIYIRTYTWS